MPTLGTALEKNLGRAVHSGGAGQLTGHDPADAHGGLEGSPGHFDPALLDVFRRIAPQFDRIFRELGE
jgi:hypothetical protein